MWGQKARAFVRKYQGTYDLKVDGKAGDATFGHLQQIADDLGKPAALFPPGEIDLSKAFAGGVHPMPIYGGARPLLTSGFIAKSGRGPNKRRLKDSGRPHYGGDLGYKWDGNGDPPLGWSDNHFTYRPERLFYCPPVEIRSIMDGEVELAGLLPVSPRWGGPRWTIRIYHGELPGFGHCSTWSTNHSALRVQVGQTVSAGEAIAIAGDTGTAGAPHNHQEIWRWQTGEQFTRESGAQDLAQILPHLELRAA